MQTNRNTCLEICRNRDSCTTIIGRRKKKAFKYGTRTSFVIRSYNIERKLLLHIERKLVLSDHVVQKKPSLSSVTTWEQRFVATSRTLCRSCDCSFRAC